MKRWLALLAFLFLTIPAHAQNVTCATRPASDSSNACASTAFVQAHGGGGSPGGSNGDIQFKNGILFGGTPLPTSGILKGAAGPSFATAIVDVDYASPNYVNVGTAPLTRTLSSRLQDQVDLADFCSGLNSIGTDIAACLGNAITQSMTTGACVRIPSTPAGVPNWKVGSPLTIGNGTGAAASTQNNLCIKGAGSAGLFGSYGSYLIYTGPVGTTMFDFLGPINNVTIEGVNLNGNNRAARILNFNSVRFAKIYDVYGSAFTGAGMFFYGMNNAGALNFMFDVGKNYFTTNQPNAVALQFNGNPLVSTDTWLSTFRNNRFESLGQGGIAVRIGASDNIVFDQLHAIGAGNAMPMLVNSTGGNATITVTDISSLSASSQTPYALGSPIVGTGIPGGTTVASPGTTTTIHMSNSASASAHNVHITINGLAATVTTTSGNTDLTNVVPATIGQPVGDDGTVANLAPGIPAGAYVTAITDTAVTLSAPPTTSRTGGLVYPVQNSTLYFTGTTANGSPTVTGVNTNFGLAAGMQITGPGILVATTILNVSGTTITLSQNASAGSGAGTALQAIEGCGVMFDAVDGFGFPAGHNFSKAAVFPGVCTVEDPFHSIRAETFVDYGRSDFELVPTHPLVKGIDENGVAFNGWGSGSATVTSVGASFTGGLLSVTGSPITTNGILAFSVAGTSGGMPYFSSANSWASSGVLTANNPILGGGAGASPISGTRTGNTTAFVTSTGAHTLGNCADWDASGNLIDAGAPCGGGGGGGVTAVTNSDSSLTISPTTGSVVASLNPAHTNTFTARQLFSFNSGTPPALTVPFQAETLAWLIGADTVNARLVLDSFGTTPGSPTVSTITLRGARTTAASPSAIQADDPLGRIGFAGYGASVYSGGRATVTGFAAENWTNAAQGAYLVFATTPIGSIITTEVARLDAAGGFTLAGLASAGTRCVQASTAGLLSITSAGCNSGTVTSVAMTVPTGFAISGSPINTTGTLALTLSGTLPASSLPNPSASTLGGIQSAAAVPNQWINSISTSGVPALSQPAFSNLSGAAAIGQLPTANSTQWLANSPSLVLQTDQVWSAAAFATLTDAATITVDMSTFINAKVTITANRTMGTPSNTKVGQTGMLQVCEDGTGGHTLSWNANFKAVGGTASLTLSTAANACDYFPYYVFSSTIILISQIKAPS